MSNESFQTNRRANIMVKFFVYSASKEYFIQPDVMEYKNPMDKPGLTSFLVAIP